MLSKVSSASHSQYTHNGVGNVWNLMTTEKKVFEFFLRLHFDFLLFFFGNLKPTLSLWAERVCVLLCCWTEIESTTSAGSRIRIKKLIRKQNEASQKLNWISSFSSQQNKKRVRGRIKFISFDQIRRGSRESLCESDVNKLTRIWKYLCATLSI